LYSFLSGYKLERDIGSEYEYSNLGAGLLGHVLALRSGMSYEALVRSRICDPLGMTDTHMTLTADRKARLAAGHDNTLAPVPNWDNPTLGGAGAFCSTATDMLKFLAAALGFVESPLEGALKESVSIRRPGENPETQMAYGWDVTTKNGSSIIWKGGATGGYRTYMGYDPKTRMGVVVLSNMLRPAMDEIGPHLLNAGNPLSSMRMLAHPEITLDARFFDRYVGTYEFDPADRMTVSREGEHFYAQISGQRRLEIFAETERNFFYKSVDAEIIFDEGRQGSGIRLTLHQNGRDHIAQRIGENR
jgi:CubicO group peptidase (beta-lactamase class C family)